MQLTAVPDGTVRAENFGTFDTDAGAPGNEQAAAAVDADELRMIDKAVPSEGLELYPTVLGHVGFTVTAHEDLRDQFESEVGGWLREGKYAACTPSSTVSTAFPKRSSHC